MKKLFQFLFGKKNYEKSSSKALHSIYIMQKKLSSLNEAALKENEEAQAVIARLQKESEDRAKLVVKHNNVIHKLDSLLG